MARKRRGGRKVMILAMVRDHWCLRGLIRSLAPSAFPLLYVCFRVRAARAYSALASAH